MGASEPPPGAYAAVPGGPPPPPGAHSGPSYPPGGPPPGGAPPGAYPPGAYPPGPPGPGGAPPPYPPGAYPAPGSYPPGAYAPAPGHPVPGHGTTTTVMYVQQSPQALPSYWPPIPQTIVCPFCSQTVVTQVAKNVGLGTWLIAGGLAFVGCIFGCCLIPFCVDSCKDTVHMCPSCNRMVGVAKLV